MRLPLLSSSDMSAEQRRLYQDMRKASRQASGVSLQSIKRRR
jgi:hypothetical protein